MSPRTKPGPLHCASQSRSALQRGFSSLTGPEHRPAFPAWEAVAVDQYDIDIGGVLGHAFGEQQRGFVDQRQHRPATDLVVPQ